MRFYMVHPDPVMNVKLLPEYAIKKVNVLEGWSILSDIGHIFDIHWKYQNKLYSRTHIMTRTLSANKDAFIRFWAHYKACAYHAGSPHFIKRIEAKDTLLAVARIESMIGDWDKYQTDAYYLLTEKGHFLNEQEKETMRKLIGGQKDVDV